MVEEGRTGLDETFKEQIRMPADMRAGVDEDAYLGLMDAAGIEKSLLIAVRAGDIRMRGSFEVPYDEVQKVCSKHPNRYYGLGWHRSLPRHGAACRP